jgi:hypothetical protein
MFYTIYKITNKINQKYYIGMHQTENVNDDYMGSGKLIKKAIKKYGIDNFTKEIIHIFDNEEDMKNKEKELVVINEMSYNLCEGGKGGFGYINSLPNATENQRRGRISADKKLFENYGDDWRTVISKKGFKTTHERYPELFKENANRGHKEGWFSWLGKKHTPETIEKMKKAKEGMGFGNKNSQYGTCWITNGQENKKIKKEELGTWTLKGYHKGRI